MLADLILYSKRNIFPPKTIGTNTSSCYESPTWCFAEEISSFHCNFLNKNPKIPGDFRPSEQIFSEVNRWVPLSQVPHMRALGNVWVSSTVENMTSLNKINILTAPETSASAIITIIFSFGSGYSFKNFQCLRLRHLAKNSVSVSSYFLTAERRNSNGSV